MMITTLGRLLMLLATPLSEVVSATAVTDVKAAHIRQENSWTVFIWRMFSALCSRGLVAYYSLADDSLFAANSSNPLITTSATIMVVARAAS